MNNISLITPCPSAASTVSTVSPDFVRVRRNSIDWTVASHLVGELFDEGGLRLNEWLQTGRAEIVKDGAHRTVYRLSLTCGRYYLKHYRAPRLSNVLLNLVRPCRAVLERDAARSIAECGVATIESVAIGRRRVGPTIADSYLMTRAIENAVPLDELVQDRHDLSNNPLPPCVRQAIAVDLGRLVGRLHSGGLIHLDLHAGNVLARIQPDGNVRLWLIDPSPLGRHAKLSIRTIERNLSLLNNFFAPFTTPADRCRFHRAYWQTMRTFGRERLPASLAGHVNLPRGIIARIEDHCAQALQICHRRNDRKWMTGNRRLIIADTANQNCRGVATIGKRQLAAIRDNPESLFAKDVVVEKHTQSPASKSACVRLSAELQTLSGCAMMVEGSTSNRQARQIWEAGHALLRRSLRCPRPLLFVEQRTGSDRNRQYLITEALPNFVLLSTFLQDSRTDEQVLRSGVKRLAREIRWMHGCCIDHAALSEENVLIDVSRCRPEFAFWGLEHVRIGQPLRARSRLVALARLNSSCASLPTVRATHRLRFLKRYCGDRFRADWKSHWRAIVEMNQKLTFDPQKLPNVFPICPSHTETVR